MYTPGHTPTKDFDDIWYCNYCEFFGTTGEVNRHLFTEHSDIYMKLRATTRTTAAATAATNADTSL